ncbi:hypothetical protein ACE6H2_001574 [Prunus campanulata]
MKGVVAKGSEELLRTSGSYLRDGIVPPESPLVTYVSGRAKADEIANALKQVSNSAAGMKGESWKYEKTFATRAALHSASFRFVDNFGASTAVDNKLNGQ